MLIPDMSRGSTSVTQPPFVPTLSTYPAGHAAYTLDFLQSLIIQLNTIAHFLAFARFF